MRKSNPPMDGLLHAVKKGLLTVLLCSSLFYATLSFNQGTFAWFTSETYAKGTIVNATTADLLTIQPSPLKYGTNCTVKSSLTISNISTLGTSVKVYHLTEQGDQLVMEKQVQPGETLVTEPIKVKKGKNKSCSLTEVNYRVDAFNEFVKEAVVVPVDSSLFVETKEANDSALEQDMKDSEVDKVTETETTETDQEIEQSEQQPVSQDPPAEIKDSMEAETTQP